MVETADEMWKIVAKKVQNSIVDGRKRVVLQFISFDDELPDSRC